MASTGRRRGVGAGLGASATGTPLGISKGPKTFNRTAFAAAHIVVDPLKTSDCAASPVFDWEKTLAFRHHLLDLGFGIAEAMDTAQRGMGLDWPGAHELIRQSRDAEDANRPHRQRQNRIE